MTRVGTVVAAVMAGLAGWSLLLPLVGTPAQAGEFTDVLTLWLWGTLITGGIVLLVRIVARGKAAAALEAVMDRAGAAAGWRAAAPAVVVFAVATALVSAVVFQGNPRYIDGFAQLFHARIFEAGRLVAPLPDPVASFAIANTVLLPDGWVSQYPPGQPLVLAAGLALGAWWLLHPLFGALLVAATFRVGRWIGDPTTAWLATILLCLSPFALAVAGSEMNHLPAAALAMGGAACATFAGGRRAWLAACAAGACVGLVAAFRPLDAVVAAIPVTLILTLAGGRTLPALLMAGVGGIAGGLPVLWYNARTVGAWLQFAYAAAWGQGVGLGFHEAPWGGTYTPLKAVRLTALELHRVNVYLFSLPVPVLPVVAAGLLTGRRMLGRRDAVPLVAVAALVGLLFFYWHRDLFFGPRLLYTAVPWLALLSARAIRGLAAWRPDAQLAVATAFAVGLAMIMPARVRAWADEPVLNLHPDREARAAGIHHAVVVIPDGWGSRLIARLWQAGIPPREAEAFYAAIDACTLHLALQAAEAAPGAPDLRAALQTLADRRRPGEPRGVTPDPRLRLPDPPLPPACLAEIRFDRAGYLAFAPFLYLNPASLDGDVVWARDLHRDNGALLRRYRGRTAWRYAPQGPDGVPGFAPLDGGSP